jgi:hypothetical protein
VCLRWVGTDRLEGKTMVGDCVELGREIMQGGFGDCVELGREIMHGGFEQEQTKGDVNSC